MRSSYDARVAEPIDRVWATITDVEALLASLPGASLSRDGDAVSGSIKCKVGSAQITYRVSVRAEVGEAKFHTAVVAVTGKEARGGGTIAATLTVALRDEDPDTRLEVSGEIEATGRAESADDSAWSRVLETMVTAALPPPTPKAELPARPPLTVAPAAAAGEVPAAGQRHGMILGVAGIVLVVLGRRLFRGGHVGSR